MNKKQITENEAEKLILTRKGRFAVIKEIFNVQPTPGQMDIIESIALKSHLKRVVISAYTQYGKTWSIAIGILLYIWLQENDGKKIDVVAPNEQSKILGDYIAKLIAGCPVLGPSPLKKTNRKRETLKKEVSRKHLTFTNDCELRILSAQGPAERLMGHGTDLLVIDAACLIDPEVYRSKISRVLGDSPDTKLVETGNPLNKNNQMWEHWTDPNFKKIHVPYTVGLEEGRVSEDVIEEQRRELDSTTFKVLYKAEFPDTVEQGLIRHSWKEKAVQRDPFDLKESQEIVGIDVAEFGEDKTVITTTKQLNNKVNVTKVESWERLDTTETADKIADHLEGHEYLVVDAIGVGSGVASRLKQKGFQVNAMKVNKSPTNEKHRFTNKKAQYYWKLRGLFEDGRIQLKEDMKNKDKLEKQLSQIQYEFNSKEKIKINDPRKSPDYAGSLMLACSKSHAGTGGAIVGIRF